VITSMTAGSDQTPPCQVDIRLDRATTHTEPPDEAVDSYPAAHGLGVAGDAPADIIVDTGPAGPVIRHIQPATTPPRVS
jgi:hypothetical protein